MPYVSYHDQVTQHTCPVCEAAFTGHPAKLYCTPRCRKRAERERERAATPTALPTTLARNVDDDILGKVENPTTEKLTEMATALRLLPGKAFQVTGTLPDGVAEGQEFHGCYINRQWDGAAKKLGNLVLMTFVG